MTPNDSEVVERHLPHDACGSSTGLLRFADGGGYCHSCSQYVPPDGSPQASRPVPSRMNMDLQPILDSANAVALQARKVSQETCRRWGYLGRRNSKGEGEQLAVYCDNLGNPVAIKVRNVGVKGESKNFYWMGDKQTTLYGRWLWRDSGKMVIVTEGEIDALSVSQMQSHQFAVVSVSDGAAGAPACVRQNVDWLNGFERVVFMFDMDAPGRDAAEKCAALIKPGRAFIASLPEKDANECLQKGQSKAVLDAAWAAKAYRPDGIVDARELTAACLAPVVTGIPWPWRFLTEWTYGLRPGEVIVLGAGTGIGKSDFLAEIVACLIQGRTKDGETFEPQACALFNYESGAAYTKKQVAGKIALRRFHIPNEGVEDPGMWSQKELEDTLALMDGQLWKRGGRLFINEAKGAINWETVSSDIRFVVQAEGVRFVFVDPMTALVAMEDDKNAALEKLMAQSWSLASELGICLFFASHLTRPSEGRSHEEGGRVTLKNFRGSNAITQWANFVIGEERNQQAETLEERLTTVIRMLKDRLTGNSTGKTKRTMYDTIAGTLDAVVDTNEFAGHPLQVSNQQDAAACVESSPAVMNSPARSKGVKKK